MLYDLFYVSSGIANKENWLRVKSRFPSAQLIENVSSFETLKKKSFTKMFWVIWDDVIIKDEFDLNSYSATKWDLEYVHVFKNAENKDGICLFPKSIKISQREFENRYFIEKKEIDIVASVPVPQIYDVVFISYYESNADKNFKRLLEKVPNAQRINGVTGIHQAHIRAAELATTELFYVVDGDAWIVDNFNFNYNVPKYEKNYVHVWRSQNPVNNLEYGYGGIKLLPRFKTINMNIDSADMTTSISNNFKIIDEVSNITAFNTDAFNTWKSAFRECVKLSSGTIARQKNIESLTRLNVWCNDSTDRFAIDGAIQGKLYGETNKGNLAALKLINDFTWLKEQFDARHIEN